MHSHVAAALAVRKSQKRRAGSNRLASKKRAPKKGGSGRNHRMTNLDKSMRKQNILLWKLWRKTGLALCFGGGLSRLCFSNAVRGCQLPSQHCCVISLTDSACEEGVATVTVSPPAVAVVVAVALASRRGVWPDDPVVSFPALCTRMPRSRLCKYHPFLAHHDVQTLARLSLIQATLQSRHTNLGTCH